MLTPTQQEWQRENDITLRGSQPKPSLRRLVSWDPEKISAQIWQGVASLRLGSRDMLLIEYGLDDSTMFYKDVFEVLVDGMVQLELLHSF